MSGKGEDDRSAGILTRVWMRLAGNGQLEGGDATSRSRLLSAFLSLLFVCIIVWVLLVRFHLMPQLEWANPQLGISGVLALFVALAAQLNRKGRYLPAAVLTVGLLIAGVFAASRLTLTGFMEPLFDRNSADILTYLVLPVVIGSVLLPPRWLLAALVFTLGGILVVPVVHPHVSWTAILYGPAMYIAAVCGLLLFVSLFLSRQGRRDFAELQQREEHFRSLFEQSPDAVFLVSGDGIIETVNQAGLSLFGYDAGELKGRHVRELYANPDERTSIIAKAERLATLRDEPLKLKKKDGSVMDCLVSVWLRRDAAGDVAGFQTIVRDVTSRVRDEEELSLRGKLLDLAHDVVLLVDPGGEIVYANESAAALTGFAVEELTGMNIRRLNTPGDAEQVPTRISTMLREGGAEFEAEWVTRDGTRISLEIRSRTIQSRGRTLFLSVGRDVTRRRADEAQLRLRGELLDAAEDSVLLHDLKGRFVYVNESAARIRGYTRRDLMAMSVQELEAPADAVRFRDRISELYARHSISFETSHVCKDGTMLPVEVRSRLIESGGVIYVLSVARDIRERRKAEESLKAERDRAQRYLDVAAVMFVVLEPDGTIAMVNREGAEVLGSTEQELVGRNWFDKCIPEGQKELVRSFFTSLMSGDDDSHEHAESDVVAASGAVRTISWHNVVLRDEAGRPSGTLSSGEDVTERRVAERRLRESEERFRALFEQSIDAIFVNAPDGSHMEANQAWLDLFGYAAEDLAAMNAADLYAEPSQRQDYLLKMQSTGSVRDEVRFKKKDGTTILCQRIASARRDAGGRVVAYQGIVRDVTAMRAAEQALRESEERYRSLFERSIDAVCLVAADGTLLDANQAYLDLYGYDAAEIGRLNVRQHYLKQGDRDEFLRRLEKDGTVVDHEVKLKRRDGTVMDCMRTSVARRDQSGRLVSIQTVTRDVTERKHAEDALRESEQRYRLIADDTVDVIWRMGMDMRFTYVNPAIERMFGFTPEEWTGTPLAEHCSPQQFRMMSEKVAHEVEHLATHTGVQFEAVMFGRNGVEFPVEIHAKILAGSDGRPYAIHGMTRDISERRRAEERLRESEEKYRTLFEQSMDAVAVYSVDGTLLDANPAHLRLCGLTREDIGRRGVLALYADPGDRDEFLRLLERDGVVIDQEVTLKKKDGTVIDCVRSAVARRDSSGRLAAAQTVTRDITARKRAEQEMRESEEKYRSLFEQSMDAVALVAVDGTLLDANPAHMALFGYRPEDLGKVNVRDHYAEPTERDDFLRRVLEHGMVVDEEVQRKRVDGTVFDCIRSAVAHRDRDGHIIAIQAVIRDITARKRAERELRESELRFRALVEHTGLGMTITRTDGTILESNDAFSAMLGYTKDEVRGLRVPDVYARKEDRETVLVKALREGYVRDAVVEFRRRDGSLLIVSMTSALVPLAGETVVVSQFLDITERKAAEREVLRSREELRRSAEQLHELTTYLEEAREKERTGIARELHDQLGQALTALRMDLEGLRRAEPSDEAGTARRIDRMASLLDDTVDDVRRISSELRPGVLDDAGLAAALEWQLDQFRARSGLDCWLKTRADDAGLDRPRATALFRVFQELLTNIARHADASKVHVVFDREDNNYVVTVSDDGRGITQEQADSTTSLGIIGMRERLRPLGGEIRFVRRRPKGTTVKVTMPVGLTAP